MDGNTILDYDEFGFGQSVELRMRGASRIGTFVCQNPLLPAGADRAIGVVMASASPLRPAWFTPRLTRGEAYNISVTQIGAQPAEDIFWRQTTACDVRLTPNVGLCRIPDVNRREFNLLNREPELVMAVTNQESNSADYQLLAFHEGLLETGNTQLWGQAMMFPVVRLCPNGLWGIVRNPLDQEINEQESCTNECPRCLNGGICSEYTGRCICSPGFNGPTCQEICPKVNGLDFNPPQFGNDCQHSCDQTGIGFPGWACRGKLFCLPHPFGCVCGPGFQGLNCEDACDGGTYGASCRSECHCLTDNCDPTNGICRDQLPTGTCSPGWQGQNCQVECEEGTWGSDCAFECGNCANQTACDITS